MRPAVFQKLVKIGVLFVEPTKPQIYYKNKMLKKLKKSSYSGPVKLVSFIAVSGTAAIVNSNKLYFWPENQPENFQIFDLYGCQAGGGMAMTSLDMTLVNSAKKKCQLRFFNHH